MREVMIARCTGCGVSWEMDNMPDACECLISDEMPAIELFVRVIEDS